MPNRLIRRPGNPADQLTPQTSCRDDSERRPEQRCETIRDVVRSSGARRFGTEPQRDPVARSRTTLRYPCAQNELMNPVRTLRYNPPPPPHNETIEINRSRCTAPSLHWNLSRAAQLRMSATTAPHSELVAVWSCPVCATPVPRWRRAGRHRVYCTNACRQKAYRQRCISRRERPMAAHRDPRPTRATTRDRVHAVREFRDVLSGRRDSTKRGISACGAFARMAIDTPERFGHVRFLATDDARNTTTCRRCQQLTGAVVSEPILVRVAPGQAA